MTQRQELIRDLQRLQVLIVRYAKGDRLVKRERNMLDENVKDRMAKPQLYRT